MSPSKGKKKACFKPPPSKGTGVICDPTPGSCATLPLSGVMCDPTHQNSMEAVNVFYPYQGSCVTLPDLSVKNSTSLSINASLPCFERF